MKKILLTLGALVCASSAFSTIWTVNNQFPEAADFSTITAAIAAAADEDTIYVQPTLVAYDFVYINHRVTLIGGGHEFNEATGYSYTPLISIQNGASGSVIKGMASSGVIVAFNVTANDITISGCEFVNSNPININNFAASTSNWTFIGNIIVAESGDIDISNFSGGLTVRNNLLVSTNSGFALEVSGNTIFDHNTVVYANNPSFNGVFYSGSPSTFSATNNIMYGINSNGNNPLSSCTQCNLENNLIYHEGFELAPILNNIVNEDPLFPNVENFIATLNSNGPWDLFTDENSPAYDAGTDGTSIGMHGGTFLFNRYGYEETLPRIASITNSSLSVPAGGLLTVNLEAYTGGYNPAELNTSNLTGVRYFFDNYTEGFDGGYSINFNSGDFIDGPFSFPIPESLGYGEHTMYVRVKDSNNKWSLLRSVTLVACDIEPIVFNEPENACMGSVATLSVNDIYNTYFWSTGSVENVTTVATGGTYTLTVSDDDCSTDASINVNFIEIPQPVIQQTETLCAGGFTILSVDDIYDTYQWTNGSVGSTSETVLPIVHTVTVTLNGCTASAEYTLVEFEYPDNTITVSGVLCEGETINLTLDASVETAIWNTGSTSLILDVDQPGEYAVELQANGCTDYANVTIDQVIIEEPIISANGNTLSVSSSDVSYQWYFNSEMIEGANGQTYEATASGNYTVMVSLDGCAENSMEFNHIYIGVNEFNLSEIVLYPNPAVNTIQLSGLAASSMKWEIQDMTGRQLMNGSAIQNTLDVSSLASGYYHLILSSNGDRMVRAFSIEK
jgi:hypothetical protein